MSLRQFTAFQPACDVEGCKWILEGDVEYWFKTAAEAAEMWREFEGWTNGDDIWVCDEHTVGPHPFVGDESSACARCGIALEEDETGVHS